MNDRACALAWLVASVLAQPLGAHADDESPITFEQHGRAQLRAVATRLPERDVRVAAEGRQRKDLALDLRWQLTAERGAWRLASDVQLLAEFGSEVRDRSRAGSNGDTDAPRGADLGRVLDSRSTRRVRARIDRLHLDYRSESFAASIGRQALSFGNGLVFAPMDFLAPFSPTETDRDFKTGDDLVSLQWRLADDRDLQLVYVARRSGDGDRDPDAGSTAARFALPLGAAELSLLAARHAGDEVAGLGVSLPVGEAIARADWIATRLADDEVAHSLVLNIDRSAVLGERNVYGFVELYRNGFGSVRTPRSLAALGTPLRERLQRGEVFTSSRWYAAMGATIEWHSLLSQQLLLIANLRDGSFAAQSNLRYEADDRQRVDLTLNWSRGERGDEFGGIAVAPPEELAPTVGGGWRLGLRYAWYW